MMVFALRKSYDAVSQSTDQEGKGTLEDMQTCVFSNLCDVAFQGLIGLGNKTFKKYSALRLKLKAVATDCFQNAGGSAVASEHGTNLAEVSIRHNSVDDVATATDPETMLSSIQIIHEEDGLQDLKDFVEQNIEANGQDLSQKPAIVSLIRLAETLPKETCNMSNFLARVNKNV